MSQNVSELLGASMAKVREMVDANTVVGTPISTGDGTTLQDAMREELEARMKYYTVPAAEADKRGLAETVDAEVETQWNSIVEQYGGVDALMEAMESAYLDEPTYRMLLRSNAAFNAIMEDTYGANGEKLSEADVLAWANDNNYVRCKHILFLTKNDDGTDMTDEEKAEVRKEAETTLEELRALESDRVHLVIRQEHRAAQAVFGADVALHDPRAAAQHDRGQGAQVKSRFGHQREQPFGVGAALLPHEQN